MLCILSPVNLWITQTNPLHTCLFCHVMEVRLGKKWGSPFLLCLFCLVYPPLTGSFSFYFNKVKLLTFLTFILPTSFHAQQSKRKRANVLSCLLLFSSLSRLGKPSSSLLCSQQRWRWRGRCCYLEAKRLLPVFLRFAFFFFWTFWTLPGFQLIWDGNLGAVLGIGFG